MKVTVALPVPNQPGFDYDSGLHPSVQPGHRVLVPLGKRLTAGYVLTISDEATEGLKPVHTILDDVPLIPPHLLTFAIWIADYYQASPGEVLQAFLPPDLMVKPIRLYRLLRQPETELDWSHVVFSLFRANGELRQQVVHTRLEGVPGGRQELNRLIRDGWIGETGFLRSERSLVNTDFLVLCDRQALEQAGTRSGKLKTFRQWFNQQPLAETTGLPLQETIRQFSLTRRHLQPWIDLGLLRIDSRLTVQSPAFRIREATPTLTAEQHTAWTRIRDGLQTGGFQPFLLYGVTGSGKTLLYMEALKEVLRQGKSGLILVPEIALTPQTVRRFEQVFGESIGVLHSRRTPADRYLEWRRILAGEHRIIIGARSALFAPIQNLGLIIVDEEHDQSYKQTDPAPRYHARDAAVYRARMAGCTIILGSATPSFESFHQAREGKYQLLTLKSRAESARLPSVRLINRREKDPSPLWSHLVQAITHRMENQQSAIILQNRRGYSHFLECEDCGWIPTCTRCSISLVWHKQGHHLRCHYCGFSQRIPQFCGRCQAVFIKPVGAGTQQVEDLLKTRFPGIPVIRMDQDTTTSRTAHSRLLDQFRSVKPAILLGTQMIAKGLDIHQVTLVGVLDADRGLAAPDFRATERSFQLLTQVAGRAGRGKLPGEVLIQTRQPELPVFRDVINHDFDRFFESEISFRRELGYPPFRRLVQFEIKSKEETRVRELAGRVASALMVRFPASDIRGPVDPVVARVADWYRQQILLFIPRTYPITRELRPFLLDLQKTAQKTWPSGSRLIIDVDPV